MRKITSWETSDGIIHPDYHSARSHADNRYGNLLTKLAHSAVRVEKYSNMVDWIGSHRQELRELDNLLTDLEKIEDYTLD